MKYLIAVFLCPILLYSGDSTKITVTISNVKISASGSLYILLVDKVTWKDNNRVPSSHKEKIAVSENNSYTATFKITTPKDPIAIKVIHDANNNGKFDMRIFPFPKPKEGAGFSNDYVPSGPPKFKQACFRVTPGEIKKTILLTYPK